MKWIETDKIVSLFLLGSPYFCDNSKIIIKT